MSTPTQPKAGAMRALHTKPDLSRYSSIVAAGLIIPRKAKYTLRDAKALVLDSLFKGPFTWTFSDAATICVCSAHFHETDYSRELSAARDSLPAYLRSA